MIILFIRDSYTVYAIMACGKPLPSGLEPGGVANFSIPASVSTYPPSDRRYKVYIPPNYQIDTPLPLIFCFHGRNMDPEYVERVSQLSSDTWNPGYIVVYPEGTANETGTRYWTGDPEVAPSTNDTVFVAELLDHLETTYCVDPSRIFATGISNGGSLVNRLACHPIMSTRIAAFAIVAGAIYPAYDELCRPGRLPIPIWDCHGGSDDQILYHGGPNNQKRGITIDIPKFMRHWAVRNGCDAANKTVEMFNGRGENYGNRTSWDCEGHAEIVQHYYSEDMKHIWPWIINEAKYNATTVILDFFKAHPLPMQRPRDGYRPDLR